MRLIKLRATGLALALASGAGPARAERACEALLLGTTIFEREVPPARPPEYFAARAVPSLFAPLPPAVDAEALPPDLSSIRVALERAQIAARPARARTLDALKAKTTFPRLIVSTHLWPPLQAPAAAWIARTFATAPPLIALVSSTPAFGVHDATFAGIVDAFLISAAGEAAERPRAHVTYLIGGYADACLSTTLRGLARAAAQAGLDRIEVRVPAALTYARTRETLEHLRDDVPPADVARTLELFYPHFRVVPDSLFRGDRTLRATLVDRASATGPFDAAWRLADVALFIE